MNILLVEDEPILAKALGEELREAGFSVDHIASGAKAIKAIEASPPGLILLDLLLPEANGFAVLEYVRESPALRHIPIIILTMLGASADVERGMALGADAYIVKSRYTVSDIVKKVKDILEHHD